MAVKLTHMLLASAVCIMMHTATFAQDAGDNAAFGELKQRLDVAVNDADRNGVRASISEIESFTEHTSFAHYAHYYLAYAWYRLYNFSTDASEKTEPKYLDNSIQHAKKAIDLMPEFAEAHIILGNAYGVKAEKSVFAGIRFGNKAKNLFQKAQKLDPENPRAAMFVGVGTMYKPAVLGGSTKKAIEEFMHAALLFESFMPSNILTPSWGHAELYAWLGQAYEKVGEYEKGVSAYKKALEIRPGYRWVRDKLLPDLENRSSN